MIVSVKKIETEDMEMNPKKPKPRLLSFDLLRLILVIFALFSHFASIHEFSDMVPREISISIKFLTRCAMPGLLIVFGFMLEYVYSNRWHKYGSDVVFRRLINRAVLCYFAFILLIFVAFMGGKYSMFRSVASITLLFPVLFANLFKYYAFLLPIAFIFLYLKNTFSWHYVMLTWALCLLFALTLDVLVDDVHIAFRHFLGLLFGIDNEWGPSIVHALIFVIFGMLSSDYLYRKDKSWGGGKHYFWALCLISLLSIFHEVYNIGINKFVANIADLGSYRSSNSYIYYSFGIISFLFLYYLCLPISKMIPSKLEDFINYSGGNTFSIFFWGNVFILLMPSREIFSFYNLGVFSLLFLIIFFLSLAVTKWIDNNENSWVVSRSNAIVSYVTEVLIGLLMKGKVIIAKITSNSK